MIGLACQQSVFQRYRSRKRLLAFYPQNGGESLLASKLCHCHAMYKRIHTHTHTHARTHTHTHQFNGHLSGTTQVGRYQKGKTKLDFTEATDSEWQWHQLGHMQVCTLLQTDNHASTPPLSFLQAGCPSCRPTKLTNSVKALKARYV